MATPRMDIMSFVGKLLEQDDVDALREGVRVLVRAMYLLTGSVAEGEDMAQEALARVYERGHEFVRWSRPKATRSESR
jgi:DNA-directed RNA polymerase specialized sigma24 family protein